MAEAEAYEITHWFKSEGGTEHLVSLWVKGKGKPAPHRQDSASLQDVSMLFSKGVEQCSI